MEGIPDGDQTLTTVLLVPGFTGSGPDHWHSHWQRAHPEYARVEQRDWDHPEPGEWMVALDRKISELGSDVVLVGHSLGCITIARWAERATRGVVSGAMLVAPSDVEAETAPPEVRGFAPIPMGLLPFPSLIVSSENDPLVTPERARSFARAWGGRFVSIGAAGHISTASGHGPWPAGHVMLEGLIASHARTPRARG